MILPRASRNPGPDRDNLNSLKADIRELIALTKENLSGLQKQSTPSTKESGDYFDKEYALLKAELEECDSGRQETTKDCNSVDIKEDLDALQGMKCQAPHGHQWGEISYHNALICSVEPTDDICSMDQIQIRVMFTNPTHQNMMPCPYYLEGECRFSDDHCRYSHGELVHLSSLKEYKEPDFSAVRPGIQVLVKSDDSLWHRAVVLTLSSKNKCEVKLESSRKMMEVDLSSILPLDGENTQDSSSDESEDDSDMNVNPVFVQQSLLTNPPSSAIGDWEKHTRGIGSRLMAQMGYVTGTGLGKYGDGRLEPVEAMVFPAGKSLDHCMALKEKAGGDENLFKVEKRLKRLQRKHERQSQEQYERGKQQTSVFDFINSKLGGKKGSIEDQLSSKYSNKDKKLKSESCQSLKVFGFHVGEEIRKTERDMARLRESLFRQVEGSAAHNTIMSKLEEKEEELKKLRASEHSIDLERSQRKNCKKLTVF
ncbi:zinc finger CCCH-type with G patch domain-containing protein isoform X2 [Periplaneta americana]|uniref:zinc finger CCCH-type with G patch domain-containing protein isoform X2 n=1 Tax=Periplaneta americana TaxID=6978 RepID=UPI0037E90271